MSCYQFKPELESTRLEYTCSSQWNHKQSYKTEHRCPLTCLDVEQQHLCHIIVLTAVDMLQDRVGRIESCLNRQSKVPSDPTVKSFGLQIKGQMMEVSNIAF